MSLDKVCAGFRHFPSENINIWIDLDFEYIYKELDVKIIDRGESFYQSRMLDVVKELESKSNRLAVVSKTGNSDWNISLRFI